MGIYQIVALGLVAAMLSLVVKRAGHSEHIGLLIGIAAAALIFAAVAPKLSGVIDMAQSLAEGLPNAAAVSYMGIVLKIIGIAYIAEFAAQLCLDANEGGIASSIELAGKVMIMVVSAPAIFALIEQVFELTA